MKIVINPGHDINLDSGACGEYSTEADINEAVANIVIQQLRAAGHEVFRVQSNELWEISQQATATGADIFVSIHCNSCDNASAHGSETWYYPDAPSERLADCIQQAIVEALYTTDRGTKNGQKLAVLNGTEVEATVLVELAFISNAHEEALLNNNQREAAMGIVEGITDYINTMNILSE